MPLHQRQGHRGRVLDLTGLPVQVWTVDDESDMRRLLEWGVDGLISNRPDVAVRARDEFLARRQTASAGSTSDAKASKTARG